MLNNLNNSNHGQASDETFLAAPPSVTLPKGGGAIKGIGESFATNPATGTLSLSVPIFTTPSRANFYPQLSLSYDSGAGNSPFGLGWHISLPAIARKTEKGLPQYRDEEGSDIFVLAGAEELVPALRESDWAHDLLEDEEFHIRRYRPRTEGAFSRIERRVDKQSGVVHWRTISRDNITSIFGFGDESRISDPEDETRVFEWLLEESFDGKGNVIRYEYKRENDENLDPSLPQEKNRLAAEKFALRYPKRIKYGNQTAHGTDWHFEVVFDYGEHHAEAPSTEEAGKWSCRPDAFSSYRAGFEIRTYRLCRRILMFHHFAELGGEPCLVRSTDLTYNESPVSSFLHSITQSGYIREQPGDGYIKQSLPPVEFSYTESKVDETVRFVDAESLEDLPEGLDGARHRWLDLDSEGLSGILSEQAGAWFYKRNLGDGRFAAAELFAAEPSLAALQAGRQQVFDLGGDGSKYLVQFAAPVPGFYQRTDDARWDSFKAFSQIPNISWDDPNLRMIDLSGDGLADILLTEDEVFVWFPSRAREGFAAPVAVRQLRDEEKGVALVFADIAQSVYLADMNGDGLVDLVRIRNGEVAYWPNLGYGRFGAKVSMDGSPTFDRAALFNHNRIILGDIDGSGTTDILYLGSDGATFWVNQSGNSWSQPHRLDSFPSTDSLTTVMLVDLMGSGTSCLVWSTPLPAEAGQPMRYLDLMSGQKPHLLSTMNNNMGKEIRIQYAPSTRFYLADLKAGEPWVTKLPFPVHVVERVETQDEVTGAKLVNQYRYRHGYYDGAEREFRGFGYVEQWDTQSFAEFKGQGLFPVPPGSADEDFHVPPAYTKTWYHTGAYRRGEDISKQYVAEYYAGDASAPLLPDTSLPGGLSADEEHEACRALKGSMLRQEIYALDDTPASQQPYTVIESSYQIRRVQPKGVNAHAVFYVYESESLSFDYERNRHGVPDPRVAHRMTLAVDSFANVTKSAVISYPRRTDAVAEPFDEQLRTTVIYTESEFINSWEEIGFYRVGTPSQTRAYEITGLSAATGTTLKPSQITHAVNFFQPAAFEEEPPAGAQRKRLVSHAQTLYYGDDLTGALPLQETGALGLPYENYKAAFTPGLVEQVYLGRVTQAMLEDEGLYVFQDGLWWIRSGVQIFDAAHFYLPTQIIDPSGNHFDIEYDQYFLLVEKTTDPLGNVIEVENNYRTMSPEVATDFNGNQTAVSFDALGMVVATALLGKPGQGEGDTLADPTTRLEYSLFNWMQPDPRPNYVRTLERERHGTANTRWRETYSYTDGFGRELMKKVQAEPGLAPSRDASGALERDGAGQPILKQVSPRWVGSGRTVYDNKGNAVKKYEPFFSSTHEYEDESDLVEIGVTPVLHYDPLGRLIRTDHPNGTFSKVEFDAWRITTWDASDTIKESSWYSERLALDVNDPANAAEIRAAVLTEQHSESPGISHLDTMGRVFLRVSDNKAAGLSEIRIKLDIASAQRVVFDTYQRPIFEQWFDMLNRKLRTSSADAGGRWELPGAMENVVRSWDSLDRQVRIAYDALQRPTHLFLKDGSAAEVLARRSIYGETHPNSVALNLRGKLHMQFDEAGVSTNQQHDFKGNLLHSNRRLAVAYQQQVDWSAIASLNALPDIEAATVNLLEPESFDALTAFDALNRQTSSTTPDQSEIRTFYNEANLLEKVDARLRGAANWTPVIKSISYNARGQREEIVYGNDARTQYTYDALTFHLVKLRTIRQGDNVELQNLTYTFDPSGNILEISDAAQQTVFFNNAVVKADAKYEYDALYRLIKAEGREHAGQVSNQPPIHSDFPAMPVPHANDSQAMRNYTQSYEYDAVGNLLHMFHQTSTSGWARHYQYDADSNRLLATSLPGESPGTPFSATYTYDAHGNMTAMPHLTAMHWDWNDRLREVDLGGGGKAFYVYDAAGQRIRKIVEHPGAIKEERIYLGDVEIYRKRVAASLVLERESLHLMDGHRRLLLVETKTRDENGIIPTPVPLMRYQLNNHLGSASLEIDDHASVISYEEYYPYGHTSYRAMDNAVGAAAKRYRYVGKERDEETGLYFYGARYYAAWLARWTAADPTGLADGTNVYAFTRGNPLKFIDPNGTQTTPPAPVNSFPGVTFYQTPTGGVAAKPAEPQQPIVVNLGPQLNKPWPYGKQVTNRSSQGRNVQRDHPQPVAITKAQRTAPDGTEYYTRAVSAREGELTVLLETGAKKGNLPAEAHTIFKGYQMEILDEVKSGQLVSESDIVARVKAAMSQVNQQLVAQGKEAVPELSTDTALLSHQATKHVPLAQTSAELSRLPVSPQHPAMGSGDIDITFNLRPDFIGVGPKSGGSSAMSYLRGGARAGAISLIEGVDLVDDFLGHFGDPTKVGTLTAAAAAARAQVAQTAVAAGRAIAGGAAALGRAAGFVASRLNAVPVFFFMDALKRPGDVPPT